jgi:hypothetical protein
MGASIRPVERPVTAVTGEMAALSGCAMAENVARHVWEWHELGVSSRIAMIFLDLPQKTCRIMSFQIVKRFRTTYSSG